MAVIADLSIGRVFCDFLVLLCLAIPLLIFHEWVTPYKRGFYCDDESIRYPYQKSTVSRQLLIVVGILIPTALIVLTELLRAMGWERRCADEFGTYRYRKYNVHRLIVRLYVFIGYFLLGICFNQLMVDIAKYTIGRHRPHFMDVCKPATRVPTRKSDGTTEFVLMDFRTNCPPDDHRYITEFECQGQNPFLIHESMLSFYSGHSAFSFYAAWYTSLYLQARIYRALVSELVLPAVQFSLFGGAAFVAYTRVSNYKHHWSDVLVGALIGSAIGIINALFIAEVFQRREVPIEYRRRRRLIDKFTAKGNEEGEEVDIEMGQVGQERGAGTRPITAGSAGGGGMVEGQNNGGSGQQQTASAGQQQQQVRYVPIRVIPRNNEAERL